jgi:hypothetical protein
VEVSTPTRGTYLDPVADSHIAGHLLERLLTSQSNVELLAHPFSASRGKQVPWLLRDDYANGMGSDELHEYKEGMLKEISGWEDALSKANEAVSVLRPIAASKDN